MILFERRTGDQETAGSRTSISCSTALLLACSIALRAIPLYRSRHGAADETVQPVRNGLRRHSRTSRPWPWVRVEVSEPATCWAKSAWLVRFVPYRVCAPPVADERVGDEPFQAPAWIAPSTPAPMRHGCCIVSTGYTGTFSANWHTSLSRSRKPWAWMFPPAASPQNTCRNSWRSISSDRIRLAAGGHELQLPRRAQRASEHS